MWAVASVVATTAVEGWAPCPPDVTSNVRSATSCACAPRPRSGRCGCRRPDRRAERGPPHPAGMNVARARRSHAADRPSEVHAVALWPGAGTSADHPSLRSLADGLVLLHVERFDFPYRREGRRPPDRANKLIASAALRCGGALAGAAGHHTGARGAGWEIDGWTDVLDGGRRSHGQHCQGRADPGGSPARCRTGAAGLPAASAQGTRTAAHRAPRSGACPHLVHLGRSRSVRHPRRTGRRSCAGAGWSPR